MKYEDAIKLMPDERLKELIDISEGRKELEEMPIDIEKYQMAQELLLLRQQVMVSIHGEIESSVLPSREVHMIPSFG